MIYRITRIWLFGVLTLSIHLFGMEKDLFREITLPNNVRTTLLRVMQSNHYDYDNSGNFKIEIKKYKNDIFEIIFNKLLINVDQNNIVKELSFSKDLDNEPIDKIVDSIVAVNDLSIKTKIRISDQEQNFLDAFVDYYVDRVCNNPENNKIDTKLLYNIPQSILKKIVLAILQKKRYSS